MESRKPASKKVPLQSTVQMEEEKVQTSVWKREASGSRNQQLTNSTRRNRGGPLRPFDLYGLVVLTTGATQWRGERLFEPMDGQLQLVLSARVGRWRYTQEPLGQKNLDDHRMPGNFPWYLPVHCPEILFPWNFPFFSFTFNPPVSLSLSPGSQFLVHHQAHAQEASDKIVHIHFYRTSSAVMPNNSPPSSKQREK